MRLLFEMDKKDYIVSNMTITNSRAEALRTVKIP